MEFCHCIHCTYLGLQACRSNVAPNRNTSKCLVYIVIYTFGQNMLLLLLFNLLQTGCDVLSKLNLHFGGQYLARLLLQCVDLVISQTSLHATIRYTIAVTGALLQSNTIASFPHHQPYDQA